MTYPARKVLPTDVTELGRGKAQRYILGALHSASGFVALTDVARGYRGHFAGLMSAAKALTRRGLLTERFDTHNGAAYRLAPHTHATTQVEAVETTSKKPYLGGSAPTSAPATGWPNKIVDGC